MTDEVRVCGSRSPPACSIWRMVSPPSKILPCYLDQHDEGILRPNGKAVDAAGPMHLVNCDASMKALKSSWRGQMTNGMTSVYAKPDDVLAVHISSRSFQSSSKSRETDPQACTSHQCPPHSTTNTQAHRITARRIGHQRGAMSARRSARLSPGHKHIEKPSDAAGSEEGRRNATLEPLNKRPRRSVPAPTAEAAASAATAAGGDGAASALKHEDGTETGAVEEGPSAYELQRLEKIKKNAMMMAALGLGGAKGDMRAAVNNDAAQRAKARGLGPRVKPKGYPQRTRYKC